MEKQSKPTTIGIPLKHVRDLPASIITHMPFIMFRPFPVEHSGNQYAVMDYLYFYHDLVVTSPYSDGEYFDVMPAGNLLAFTAESFDKKVGMTVIRNTYYFNVNLCTENLKFQMSITEAVKDAYNNANPNNPIGGEGFVNPETGLPMFFTHECEIIIPPTPPS